MIGRSARFRWPGSSAERAGLRLVLVHVEELLHTRSFPSGRAVLRFVEGATELVPLDRAA